MYLTRATNSSSLPCPASAAPSCTVAKSKRRSKHVLDTFQKALNIFRLSIPENYLAKFLHQLCLITSKFTVLTKVVKTSCQNLSLVLIILLLQLSHTARPASPWTPTLDVDGALQLSHVWPGQQGNQR